MPVGGAPSALTGWLIAKGPRPSTQAHTTTALHTQKETSRASPRENARGRRCSSQAARSAGRGERRRRGVGRVRDASTQSGPTNAAATSCPTRFVAAAAASPRRTASCSRPAHTRPSPDRRSSQEAAAGLACQRSSRQRLTAAPALRDTCSSQSSRRRGATWRTFGRTSSARSHPAPSKGHRSKARAREPKTAAA